MNRVKPKKRSAPGYILLESLVAVIVLSIFLIGLVPVITGATIIRKQQQYLVEASGLAQLQLEETRRYWSLLSTTGTVCDPSAATPAISTVPYPVNFSPPNPLTGACAAAYNEVAVPLFGETDSTCTTITNQSASRSGITSMGTSGSPKLGSVGALTDPTAIAVTNANVVTYAIRKSIQVDPAGTGGCSYKDQLDTNSITTVNGAIVNNTQPIRYVAQIFYGTAPTSTNTSAACQASSVSGSLCIRRVAVRIYQANNGNVNCAFTTPLNCIPTTPAGAYVTQPGRPTTNNTTRATNADVIYPFYQPLIVLTTDIASPI
jgi:type II secretory pathway pseudopilin PulG